MKHELPGALRDLKSEGSKKGHWRRAWPRSGRATRAAAPAAITAATAPELLRSAPPGWREILEKVCELIDYNGGSLKKVVPPVDWGRIEHFVAFFEALPDAADKPEWLRERVLPCLKAAVATAVSGAPSEEGSDGVGVGGVGGGGSVNDNDGGAMRSTTAADLDEVAARLDLDAAANAKDGTAMNDGGRAVAVVVAPVVFLALVNAAEN